MFELLQALPKISFGTSLATLLGLYLISQTTIAIYNLFFHPIARYPGPAYRAAFYFPDGLSKLKGTSYKDTKLLHDQYGPVVRIAPDALSYTTAQAWKDIYTLKSDRTQLAKDPAYYQSSGGTNIVAADHADHTRMRKVLAHAFTESALLEQEPLLTHYFDLLVSKLKQQIEGLDHGRVDMMAYYNFTTFDIIGDLVLGESFGALEEGQYHYWIRNVFEAIKFLGVMRFAAMYPAARLLLKFLRLIKPSLAARRVAHLAFTKAKIEKRLQRKTDRKDFMTYILRHNDSHGITHEEILGNSRVLLTAGSETTATLLSGATYHLLRNPAALQRVRAEIRTVFKSAEDITLRSVSDQHLLPYLDAVLRESLRCHPSIPATLPRITGIGGAVIDGNHVPENISVGVHQWSTYRSPANFASPDSFVPERWLSDAPQSYLSDEKAALQPFSLGPRGCIGKGLAFFEMRSILARILWNFDMQLDGASEGWTDDQKEYTLWDKPPLWVKLSHKEHCDKTKE